MERFFASHRGRLHHGNNPYSRLDISCGLDHVREVVEPVQEEVNRDTPNEFSLVNDRTQEGKWAFTRLRVHLTRGEYRQRAALGLKTQLDRCDTVG